MKLMGIDYGRRRIGIAVTDSSGQHIRGLTTIDRKKHPDPIIPIISIIRQENPDLLVLGLPLDINDAETVMSKEVRCFAESLKERSGKPVDFADESRSSRRASELMLFRKKKQRRDKAATDRLAACLILETYREDHL
ncbi:MAG TPA: Holliday junction resolvase RuvX [Chitinispirillaceae bacterium]|jgi:putative Holliday junction resolvase|nr:Holliday junction resolvase RuvX [Chitinispirillaceae bacterium]